jgi:hypothetical protein
VCDLIDSDLNWWNILLIKEIFMEEEVERICSMAICPHTQQDRVVWAVNKSGLFTVHSAYHLAKEMATRADIMFRAGHDGTLMEKHLAASGSSGCYVISVAGLQ